MKQEQKQIRISVVTPVHNEKIEQLRSLLLSLETQVGIDFNEVEFLFCSDTDDHLKEDLLHLDKLGYQNISPRIKFLQSNYKQNPGMSRQTGIDNALGEYIMFIDADDMLFNCGVIREIFENVNNTHADVYRYKFIEEVGAPGTDRKEYLMKEHNWIWVFDKIYRAEFLRQHNVRFNETIRWHEDSYFNIVLKYLQPKTVDIQSTPSYLWRYTDYSVTRLNNHEYTFNSQDELLDAWTKAYKKLLTEYRIDCSQDILLSIVRIYTTLCDPANKDKEKKETIEKCYFDFLKTFIPGVIEKGFTPEFKKITTDAFFLIRPGFIPEISLETYINQLKEKYEKSAD